MVLLVTAAERDGITGEVLTLPASFHPTSPPTHRTGPHPPLTHSHVAAEVSGHPVGERENRSHGRALGSACMWLSNCHPQMCRRASRFGRWSLTEPTPFCAARSDRGNNPLLPHALAPQSTSILHSDKNDQKHTSTLTLSPSFVCKSTSGSRICRIRATPGVLTGGGVSSELQICTASLPHPLLHLKSCPVPLASRA